MQKFVGSCSSEQLHTLQSIFDLIWMELRASSTSNYSGPSDPDVLRDEIARRVIDRYNGDDATPSHQIVTQILASFGIERPAVAAPAKANSDGKGAQ
jgi:hypothetical protein